MRAGYEAKGVEADEGHEPRAEARLVFVSEGSLARPASRGGNGFVGQLVPGICTWGRFSG